MIVWWKGDDCLFMFVLLAVLGLQGLLCRVFVLCCLIVVLCVIMCLSWVFVWVAELVCCLTLDFVWLCVVWFGSCFC